jgi:hypothetical protein
VTYKPDKAYQKGKLQSGYCSQHLSASALLASWRVLLLDRTTTAHPAAARAAAAQTVDYFMITAVLADFQPAMCEPAGHPRMQLSTALQQ